jgi:hypothetical protein
MQSNGGKMIMKISEDEIPEKVGRRIELSKLFYPLERKYERRWGRTFDSGFDQLHSELQELAEERQYFQDKIDHNTILWKDAVDGTAECMFCLINDATNLGTIQDVFQKIEKYKPVFTYAVVHQVKDGEGVFDIFRLSKFSYMEHCNRVRAPKRKNKKL